MTTFNGHFLIKLDTAANWTANNPILKIGEKGRESDTGKEKCGDGVTGWVALAYDISVAALASPAAGQGDAMLATLGTLAGEVASTQHLVNQQIPSVMRWFTDAQKLDVLNNTGSLDVGPAIATAYAASKQLIFPPGTYKASVLPDFGVFGTRIIGIGKVVINFTGTGVGLTVNGTAGMIRNVTIENITLNGTASATTGIVFGPLQHCHFRNLRVNNFPTLGFQVVFNVSNLFENLICSTNGEGNTLTTVTGLQLDCYNNTPGQCPSNNTFVNMVMEGVTGTGIVLNSSSGSIFIGGTSEGNAGGIYLHATDGTHAGALRNKFIDMDLEANTSFDVQVYCQMNTFESMICNSAVGGGGIHLYTGANFTQLYGGQYYNVVVDLGVTNTLFCMVNWGSSFTDNSTVSTTIGTAQNGSQYGAFYTPAIFHQAEYIPGTTKIANGASTSVSPTARYSYITTSAASLATTFPAGSALIDGLIMTVCYSAGVATATWVSSGATFVGAPGAIVANTPYRFIYQHSSTQWLPY